MGLVLGTNAVILFYSVLTDSWVPYGCARTGDIEVSTEFIETTIKGNGKWKKVKPTKNSGSGTLEGLHNLNTPGLVSIADLQAKQFAQERLLMRYDYQDDSGNSYVLEGYFYISGSRINNSFDNVSTFNVDFILSGELTQYYTPTPIIRGVVIRKEFLIAAGQDDITITEIDGLDPENILLVTLNGYDYEEIILTGTPIVLPAGAQVLYQQSGGKLQFPFTMPVDTNGVVLYQTVISGS